MAYGGESDTDNKSIYVSNLESPCKKTQRSSIMASAQQSAESRDLNLLDKVELKIALADSEAKLQNVLNIYLPPLLLKLASEHVSVRNKVRKTTRAQAQKVIDTHVRTWWYSHAVIGSLAARRGHAFPVRFASRRSAAALQNSTCYYITPRLWYSSPY